MDPFNRIILDSNNFKGYADHMRVVQIGIKMLINTEAMNNWCVIMAGVLMALIPPLIVFFVMQKSFMKGFGFMREK